MIHALGPLLAVLVLAAPAAAFWDPVTSQCRPPMHRGTAEATDGDTLCFTRAGGFIDILRLVGIDAPEPYQICRIDREPRDCGLEARDGRADLGEAMLRAGMATSHAYFANNLQSAESWAIRARRSLWRGDWVHPSAWRQGHRLGEGPCGGGYLPE